MNLTDQVCSLELAQRLKELGVKQDSLFYWNKFSFDYGDESFFSLSNEVDQYTIESKISAFTVTELLDLIPPHEDREIIDISKSDEYYLCQEFFDKNLANCCARMLIYLIDNKLVEINK